MKALDIVRTPKGGIAIVVETNGDGNEASIDYINGCNPGREHNAWWGKSQLKVIDSVPHILAKAMKHPFGSGGQDVEKFFGIRTSQDTVVVDITTAPLPPKQLEQP